jgi:D-galactose 1-dehydrogenase
MGMPHRVGIIGIGKIAQDQHLPVIAKDRRFSLAAIVSQRGVELPGVPSFRTPAEMYEAVSDLDAVAICTPPSVRYRIAKEALAAGKHVLLEKPPTPTVSELLDLAADAERRKCVLFTAWHSQFNAAVDEAQARLKGAVVRAVDIQWKEDVRYWHPGQGWVWRPGGFGVFDPGINALSIVTKIMPEPIFVETAALSFPANCDTPIAASLSFKLASAGEATLGAEFDWRQTGEQTWNIAIALADGRQLKLTKGGTRLAIDDDLIVDKPSAEYEAIYDRFDELLRRRESDVDPTPLRLVADAFMLGRRIEVEEFHE